MRRRADRSRLRWFSGRGRSTHNGRNMCRCRWCRWRSLITNRNIRVSPRSRRIRMTMTWWLRTCRRGKYRVVAHESQFGYVSSMRCGDTDVQHSILEVGPGVTMPPIEITMRDNGAEVSGTVVDVANRNRGRAESTTWQPSPGVVYFVPVHEGAEMKQAWVEPNGDFQLPQLAPGVIGCWRLRRRNRFWSSRTRKRWRVTTRR